MKYHNKKTVIDGITFDSKRESQRYCELKLLQRAGKICDIELQPTFVLQDKFTKGNTKYQPIKYKADFAYYDLTNRVKVIEDVKGVMTKEFAIKRKMFEFKYPNMSLTIVK